VNAWRGLDRAEAVSAGIALVLYVVALPRSKRSAARTVTVGGPPAGSRRKVRPWQA
jgi:hypothetical protein